MALDLMRRPWTGPFGELSREVVPLRTMMDRLFESAFAPSFWTERAPFAAWSGSFGMDVYESPEAYTIHCLLPGADPERVSVTMQDNVLTISGESQRTAPEGAQPLFQEIGYGQFQRQVTLGAPVEAEQAQASYHDGILTITLPKAESAKPRHIKINTNGYTRERPHQAQQATVTEAKSA